MKKRLLPLLLALSLLLSVPVCALNVESFQNGQLSGVCAAGDGALLVTDVFNKVIWRVSGDAVTRYAGVIGVADLSGEPVGVYHDGVAEQAYFMEPWDIAPFLEGYAVTDAAAHVVRYIANGRVYTLAGSSQQGNADGIGRDASFLRPTGLAAAPDGSLYVADTEAGSIRRIAADGNVTTYASGLNAPTGLCWSDGALYVAETGSSRIVRVASGAAAPFAGALLPAEDDGEYYGGYADGAAGTARFDHPQGLAAGADGTVYVADTGNGAVRAISEGRVYTLARSDDHSLMPASPRGLLPMGDTLWAADRFAGNLLAVSAARKTYADVVPGAWYAAAVDRSVRFGIALGTSDTLFEPNAALSRAMFVTMLSRVHRLTDGSAIVDGDTTFPDVDPEAWYAAPVRWAADSGIAGGEGGLFVPARSISRQELAVMLYRYAAAQGMDTAAPSAAFDAFPDRDAAADWARTALGWACAKGILHGSDLGLLDPAGQATRAQALTMLGNFMEAYGL